jgi:thiamine kinase-like enzyme
VAAPSPNAALDRVDALLDEVAAFTGVRREVEPLPGGLTNRNFKVTTPTATCVARFSPADTKLLAIDREAEYRNSVAAAQCRAGPAVVDYLAGKGLLVINWISGRTFSVEDLRAGTQLGRVAEACKLLHSGARFGNDFDMFAIQRRYLQIVTDRGFRLPARYVEFMPKVDEICSALTVQATKTVPCHNDLLAENFIDDGDRLWLIDYEYSGNNDPCFELGNIWSEADLTLDQLEELVGHYYSTPSRSLIARARLLGLMSKYGWTLWASIQDGVSDLDFDFWSWGMEKYDRAVAEFDGPDLPRLLVDVQQPGQRGKG